ncbi:Transglycosylase SLT domain protein [uncultured Desulfatiglans sp.]|uniref:Transglycosylase SLT domain protein n=1 Tax=Uncultured Desulfatiglans sp. TaxID=1748965 RepID=A0A653AHN4_UNCDX|nr:Transglycosylase SLT domain protein [uncultured Desulfatiglans sp.]
MGRTSCRIGGLAAGIILFLAWTGAAMADIYRYVDKNGVVHFTNIKKSERYKPYIRSGKRVAAKRPQDYDAIIHRAARRFNLQPELIKAVIKAESDFNSRAVSNKGAQGLMQLMPPTAVDLDVMNPFDPEQNIFGGVRYLSELHKRFNNDTVLALAAYNAGPERVMECQGVPPFKETHDFIARVKKFYLQYCRVGD